LEYHNTKTKLDLTKLFNKEVSQLLLLLCTGQI